MDPERLQAKLKEQIHYYSDWAFEQAYSFDELDSQQFGKLDDPGSFYQVKVWTVQKEDDFVEVAVSVDDGGIGGRPATKPISETITFYRDGRVNPTHRLDDG